MTPLQIVSYPKSGRSWIRYAMTRLGHGHVVTFHHDGFEFNDGARPPLNFDADSRRARLGPPCRVVYLARDPRDIIVSLYHQVTGRFRDFFQFQGDISAFIRDGYFGARNLHRFQQMWERLCGEGLAIKVTYEDCHADLGQTLSRILGHLGLSFDDRDLREAVEASSFDRMRQVEISGAFPEPWLRLRNGAPKVRKGQVAGYLEALSTRDIDYLEAVFSASVEEAPHGSPCMPPSTSLTAAAQRPGVIPCPR